MNPILDNLLHSGELVAFLIVAWRVIRRLNRDETLKQDFPPHRHIGDEIVYPKEYQPARAQRLGQ